MTEVRTDTWMPLYIGDYMADTGRLTTEGHGAYLLLLMDYWRNGAPPDHDEILAAITKLPLPRWKKLRPTIQAFFRVSDGRWLQKRAEEELANAASITDKRREAGKAGAEARWGKPDGKGNGNRNGKLDGKGMAEPLANPMRTQWQNDGPSPSPSQSPKEDGGGGTHPRDRNAFDRVYAELEKILNRSAFNGSRIWAWIEAGADPELDIFPTVKRLNDDALKKGEAIGSLRYFDNAIKRAVADRTQPMTNVAREGGPRNGDTPRHRDGFAALVAEELDRREN